MFMTYEQEGVYRRLLDHQSLHGSIPLEIDRIACLLPKMDKAKFRRIWVTIEPKFPENSGKRVNLRMAQAQLEFAEFSNLKSKNGRKGANQRWQSHRSANGKPIAEPMANGWPASASASASAKEQKMTSRATEPPDPRVKEFLDWFQDEFFDKRHGASYLVSWPKDVPIVKRLLKTVGLPELQDCARILLSDKTDDDFITNSDRGIGILSTKFNWLEGKRAAWMAKQTKGFGVA